MNRASVKPEIITPPWIMMPPTMHTYEERGARLLSKSLWKTKCFKCIWANMSNVEIQWDFDKDIKNTDLKPFVMDQNHANFIKWVERVQYHIKIGWQILMMDI